MKKKLIYAYDTRARGGRERPAFGVRGHANSTQIWAGFESVPDAAAIRVFIRFDLPGRALTTPSDSCR
jgi:hypothetical protein